MPPSASVRPRYSDDDDDDYDDDDDDPAAHRRPLRQLSAGPVPGRRVRPQRGVPAQRRQGGVQLLQGVHRQSLQVIISNIY